MVPTTSTTTSEPTPSPTDGECQYELITQVLDWWDAELYCRTQYNGQNGHLLSIHNDQEAQLAHQLCDTNDINPEPALPAIANGINCCCWIGLNDHVIEGIYLWSDDSEYDYSNWYDDREGTFIADVEDCAVVTEWTFKWFDRECAETTNIGGFICQYGCDKAPQTDKPTSDPIIVEPTTVNSTTTTLQPVSSDRTTEPTIEPTSEPTTVVTARPKTLPPVASDPTSSTLPITTQEATRTSSN